MKHRSLIYTLVGIIAVFLLVFFLAPEFTGYSVYNPQTYNLIEINQNFSNSTIIYPLSGTATSLLVKGSYSGSGKIQVTYSNGTTNYTIYSLDSTQLTNRITGFVVANRTGTVLVNDTNQTEEESEPVIEEVVEPEINNTPPELNETEEVLNETLSNETFVEPELNETEIPEINITPAINVTVNQTPELNLTTNVSINVTSNVTLNTSTNVSTNVTVNESIPEINIALPEVNVPPEETNITNETVEDVEEDLFDEIINFPSQGFIDYDCEETCDISPIKNGNIIVHVEGDIVFSLEAIAYKPYEFIEQTQNFVNASSVTNETFALNLSEYFKGTDVVFDIPYTELDITLVDNIAYIEGTEGSYELFFYAANEYEFLRSNTFTFIVQDKTSPVVLNTTKPEWLVSLLEQLPPGIATAVNASNIPYEELRPLLEELANKGSVRVMLKNQELNALPERAGAQGMPPQAQRALVNAPGIELAQINSRGVAAQLAVEDFSNLLTQLKTGDIILDTPLQTFIQESLTITATSQVHGLGYGGSGVNICVIDTGFNYDLFNLSVVSQTNVFDNSNNITDLHGHGTEVLSVVSSFAPEANYILVKALADDGTGYASDIITGIETCVAQNAGIISLSLGGGSYAGYCVEDELALAVNDAVNTGSIIFAATGNDGLQSLPTPACAEKSIPIGSSTKTDALASFTNYNNATLLLAPGESVTVIDHNGANVVVSGTSISTPMVAGVGALLQEQAIGVQGSVLNTSELERVLVQTGQVINATNRQFSRINSLNALQRNYTNNLTRTYLGEVNGSVENVTVFAAPSLDNSSILPSPAYITDTLLGYCEASDADGDNVTYEWEWYKNDVLNSSGSPYSYCYQETANASNFADGSCALNYSGTYSFSGTWTNLVNIYDGNYSTFGSRGGPPLSAAYYYVNYSKPPFATNESLFQIKHTFDGGTVTFNETIRQECWDDSSDWIQFRVWIDGSMIQSTISCYNGSTYFTMNTSGVGDFYEEGMYWVIPDYYTESLSVNVANVTSDNLVASDTWIFSCRAYDGTSYSSWVNSTEITIQEPPTLNVSGVNITSPTNSYLSSENLSVEYTATEAITNITDWRRNGTSIALVNLAFDTNITSTSAGAIRNYATGGYTAQLGDGVSANVPAWSTDCIVGGCYDFDGSNDQIVFDNFTTSFTLPLTIEAWVRAEGCNNQASCLGPGIFAFTGSAYNGPTLQLTSYSAGSHVIFTGYGDGGGTASFDRRSAQTTTRVVSENQWYHIVSIIRDATDMDIYLNGTKQTISYSGSGTSMVVTGVPKIGAAPGSSDWRFNGSIDGVKFYTYELSPEQIQANYEAGLAGKYVETIVSNETTPGENWSVAVTANNVTNDSTTVVSAEITIEPIDAPIVSLSSTTPALTDDVYGYCAANYTETYAVGFSWVVDATTPTEGFMTYTGSVASANTHACALLENRSIICWGTGTNGELGYGGTAQQTNPVPINSSWNFAQVAVDIDHSCGLLINGSVACWGSGANGRLGTGGTSSELNPALVNSSFQFASITAGNAHSCGVLVNGSVACWGLGSSGQLGTGGTSQETSPALINSSWTFRSVSAGGTHTCGVLTNNSVACWGTDAQGQLGNGATTGTQTSPVLVDSTWEFISVSAGGTHTCGVLTNGSGVCWGEGTNGRLGTSSETTQTSPTLMNSSLTWLNIDAGQFRHTCGVTVDGNGACWGSPSNGRLGISGASVDVLEPTLVTSSWKFTEISAGDAHSCAILENQSLSCWGPDTDGRTTLVGTNLVPALADTSYLSASSYYPSLSAPRQYLTARYYNYSLPMLRSEDLLAHAQVNLSCTVYTADFQSETVTQTATVANTVPTTPTTLTPTSGTYDDTISLVCSGSTDADTDSLLYTFQSNRTGSWTTIVSNDVDGLYDWDISGLEADNVALRCYAYDGYDVSSTYSPVVDFDMDKYNPRYSNLASNHTTQNGDVVHFNATFTDLHLDTCIFEYYNGSTWANTTNSSCVSGQPWMVVKTMTGIRGDIINWSWWANDTFGNWNQTAYDNFTLDNYIPSSTNVSFQPSVAYTDDALIGYCGFVDGDGDTLQYYWRWYVNTTIVSSGNGSFVTQGTVENSANLSSSFTAAFDTLIFSCLAYDGIENSTWVNSSSLVITNTPPTISSVTLASTSGGNFVFDNLSITSIVASDLDNHTITNITDWRMNGTSIAVLNMPFDTNISDNSSDAIIDYTTFINHGQLGAGVSANAPTWTSSCQVGGCYDFDGTDVIIIPDNDSLDFASKSFSISVWANADNINQEDYAGFVTKDEAGGFGTFTLALDNTASDVLRFGFRNSTNGQQEITTVSGIPKATWFHIVGTYDVTTRNLSLYIDGVLNATMTTEGVPKTVTSNVRIGGRTAGAYDFTGLLDEVLIFNRTLTPEQITQLYSDQSSGKHLETIVSQETLADEVWSVNVTPTDSYDDGTSATSNEITVIEGECIAASDCGVSGYECLSNFCFANPGQFAVEDASCTGDRVFIADKFGRIGLTGGLSQSCSETPSNSSFIIQNSTGVNAWVDRDGSFCVGGTVSEEQSSFTMNGNDWVVQNGSADIVSMIDGATGNVLLRNRVIEYITTEGNVYGSPFVLDLYPDAEVAYSLRLLDSDYTGPLVQIRRDSDNATKDFYPDCNNELSLTSLNEDGDTLSSWIGSDSGTVPIWYDQSGNARNLTQGTVAYEFKIINAGSLYSVNGKTAMLGIWFPTNADPYTTTLTLAQPFTLASSVYLSQTAGGSILFDRGADTLRLYNPNSAATTVTAGTAQTITSDTVVGDKLYYVFFNGTTSEIDYNNGAEIINQNLGTNGFTGTLSYAQRYGGGWYQWRGYHKEFIIWNGSVDKSTVLDDLDRFY